MSDKELNEIMNSTLNDITTRYKLFVKRLIWLISILLVATLGLTAKSIWLDSKQNEKLENTMTYEDFMEYKDLIGESNILREKQIDLNTQRLNSMEKHASDQLNVIDKELDELTERIRYIERNYSLKTRGSK